MTQRLFTNSLIYTLSSFVQKGLSFLLIPLYIHHLNAGEFGSVTVVLAIIYISSILFTLGLDSAIVRFYYDKTDKKHFQEFFGSIIIAIFTLAIVNYCLMTTLFRPVIEFFLGDIQFSPYAYIGFAVLIFQPFYNFALSFIQAKNDALKYATLSFIYFFVNVSLTISFVVFLGWRGTGYLLALLIAQFIAAMVALFFLRKEFILKFSLNHIREAISYSFPLIPHSLASQAANYADRFIINKFIDATAVGIYQVAAVLSMPVELLTFSVNRAFMPTFFKAADGKEGISDVIESSVIILIIYLTAAAGISYFSSEILSIFFDKPFHFASLIIPIMAFAFVNSGLYYIFSSVLFYEKRLSRYIPVCTVAAGAITITSNFFLVPLFGLFGAAVSLFFGQLVLAVSAYFFGKKSKLIYWPLKTFVTCYLTFMLPIACLYYADLHRYFIAAVVIKMFLLFSSFAITNIFIWKKPFYLLNKLKSLLKNSKQKR